MRNLHCISIVLLVVLLQGVCEGKILPEFQEESEERTLTIHHGQLSDKATGKYCACNSENCECCYRISSFNVCTQMKLAVLEKDGNELALQGTININNGSIFTYAMKLKDFPRMCYQYINDFDACFRLKQEYIEDTKLQVCGHIKAKYSSMVLLNVDLFCRTFEIKKKNFLESEAEADNGSFSYRLNGED